MKANRIGHTLRRNCFLKYITKRNIRGIQVTGKQGRRYKQLMDGVKERRG